MDWLLLLPPGILTLTLLALLGVNRLRADFKSNWLLSAAGAAISMLVFLYLRIRLPLTFLVDQSWALGLGDTFIALSWTLNSISMPLAMAVAALLFASIVVQVQRGVTEPWWYWAPGIALALAAMLAVLAGNAVSLALSWTFFDALLLVVSLHWLKRSEDRPLIMANLVFGFVSTLMLLSARWLVLPSAALSFDAISASSLPLLLLAAGLRLGVLPINPFLLPHEEARAEQGLMLRLLPAAVVLPLLGYSAALGLASAIIFPILGLIAALFFAARWLRAASVRAGFADWILGMAALVFCAASLGAPVATQALALTAILAGGGLLLQRAPYRLRLISVAGGLVLLLGLPFTPMHGLAELLVAGQNPLAYVIFLPYALLVFGWLRFAAAAPEMLDVAWARAVYALGTFSLPVVLLLFGLGLAPDLSPRRLSGLPVWGAALVGGLAILAFVLSRRGPLLPQSIADALLRLFSFRWLYRSLATLLTGIEWLMRFVGRLLEGRAGLLWALLFVTLLLSVVTQLAVGS
jgi:hypothetical protein